MFFKNNSEANNDGDGGRNDSLNPLENMPSFEEHMKGIANEANSDLAETSDNSGMTGENLSEEANRAIERGYFEDVPEEKLVEEVGSIMTWEYDHVKRRSGCYADSTYYYYPGADEDPKAKAIMDSKIEDARARYFSEQAPQDKKEAMQTILKKMRFSKDIGERLGIEDSWYFHSVISFTERNYCAQKFSYCGEYGIPNELKKYSFDLSDDELSLLANAEDDDALANSVKMVLPDTMQKKILEKMPDERFKDVVLENLKGAVKVGDYLIDWEGSVEWILKEVSEKRKKAESAYEIIKELNNKETIQKVVDFSGVNMYSIPGRREFVGIERYRGNGFEL